MEHRKLDYDSIKHQLSRRDREAHKGSYGHVLVIGGDKGFGGAALMAGMSAAVVDGGFHVVIDGVCVLVRLALRVRWCLMLCIML